MILILVCCFLLNFLSRESEDGGRAQQDDAYQMILSVRHGSPRVSDDPRSVTAGCSRTVAVSFADVIFDASQNVELVRGDREDTFDALVPSCCCCAPS